MMCDLETIYEDTTAWVQYEPEEGNGVLHVYCRCQCGRYITHGRLFYNKFTEEMKLTGWICNRCGEIDPYHEVI